MKKLASGFTNASLFIFFMTGSKLSEKYYNLSLLVSKKLVKAEL